MRRFSLQQLGQAFGRAAWLGISFTAGTVLGQQLPQRPDGLTGYISMSISTVPDAYGYGVSFYSSVWPLLEKPLAGFQIGLPSTWITPDNRTFTSALCPPGTYAADNWSSSRGPYYRDVFQTIEGGMGFWVSTQFGTTSPKFRMNGTPDCYSDQVASPGWGFGNPTSLPSTNMGLAQLSNRLLVPPDGLTFQNGANGQLLGMAWMAMPYSETVTDYFALTTSFVEGQGLYLNGNKVESGAALGGAAYMSALSASNTFLPGQLWKTLSANGYFGLTTRYVESAGLVFEGNKVVPGNYLGGASFMALPSGPGQYASGQLWKLLPSYNGYFALTTAFVENDGLVLEGNKVAPGSDLGGATHMTPYFAPGQYFTGQLWRKIRVPDHGTQHTGPLSWTLFLNAANFKGPLAFWLPQAWSRLSDSYSVIEGRGLDTRLGLMASGAMEFNTVPCFQVTNAQGIVYTRIPKILFPVNSNGVTPLMQDVTMYSSGAIYEQALDWFNGGGTINGRFNSAAAFTPGATAVAPGFQQGSGGPTINGLNNFFSTTSLGPGSFGLQWVNATNQAAFPEYFQRQNNVTTAVSASAVPDSTNLKTQNFLSAYTGGTYTSTGLQWSIPGPASGPYQVHLSDGTIVTYAWYRFVDQPAFQHLNLTPTQKQRWQSIIELVHSNWRTTSDFIPPPSQGTVVTLDIALLVTPPAGLEVGYVPIVTKQEMGSPWLMAKLQGNQVIVSWNIGQTLQSAANLNGPWQTVTNAPNPYSTVVSGPSRFFRVVSP